MGRFLSQLLSLAIAALVISFVVAPYYAFFALRSAAQSNDAAELAELIDYGKVRGSLRGQLEPNSGPPGPPPNVWQDPIGALRRSLEPMGPTPNADAYLTPYALAALTEGQGRAARNATPEDLAGDKKVVAAPYPAYRYWGVGLARLAVKDAEHGDTLLTFERQGWFEWKLTHIGLPPVSDGTTVRRPQATPPRPAERPVP